MDISGRARHNSGKATPRHRVNYDYLERKMTQIGRTQNAKVLGNSK